MTSVVERGCCSLTLSPCVFCVSPRKAWLINAMSAVNEHGHGFKLLRLLFSTWDKRSKFSRPQEREVRRLLADCFVADAWLLILQKRNTLGFLGEITRRIRVGKDNVKMHE